MNRSLVLEQRDAVVAERITAYLKATDRFAKTIVFCEDIDHAARMRQALSNANADLCATQPRYVVQITGDNPEGKRELDNFIDPEKPYPVIATTSKLLSTGVDAQTCKLIVLDQNIKSMTLFKQIIGRGTRLREDLGKTWFTILDFKRATELFADPSFDGDPVVYSPEPDAPIVPPDETDDPTSTGQPDTTGVDGDTSETGGHRIKYVINDVPVYVVNERVQYYGPDGKLITESLRDYTRIQIGKRYASLDDFLQQWNDADRKAAIIAELEAQGILFDELAKETGKALDPFDLVCHIAFGQKPLTRRERAEQVKKRDYFGKYAGTARKVLELLLDKYADAGISEIESLEVLKLQPFDRFGSVPQIIKEFGGKPQYLAALRELERGLYQ
jgi:type I restriction enzyme R subunit